MTITETVLEMHYHRALMDLFRETYGLGPTGKVNFYKYSPQREVFLGFDQAFATTEVSDKEFFDELKASAMTNGYKLSRRFAAYFLQFKVVVELKKRQKQTPVQIKSRPHYRAALDTTKNDMTGFSQHELLFNLNQNDGAMVYYACPMIFEKADLYELNVDLDRIRLVDLASCKSDFTDNSNHYVYFDTKTSQPVWCSAAFDGRAVTPKQLFESIGSQLRQLSPSLSVERMSRLIGRIKGLGSAENEPEDGTEPRGGLALVADSLTIVRVDESDDNASVGA